MQGMIGERMNGLTEGTSSRYLRANRSQLLPSLARMRQTQSQRTEALHGRLEELLVFEIQKDGDTEYHRFSVRTLHKYVLNAIKTATIDGKKSPGCGVGKSSRSLLDQLALGRAIVNGSVPGDDGQDSPGVFPFLVLGTPRDMGLGSIDETEPLDNPSSPSLIKNDRTNEAGTATYREKLGGFLHPRDMRKLVTPFSASNEPELIVRRHAMLLNFDPLRAIILRDRLLVLVPDGADSLLVSLERRVRGGSALGNMLTGSESSPSLDGMVEKASESSSVSGVQNGVTLSDIPEKDAAENNIETQTDSPAQLGEDADSTINWDDNELFNRSFIDNEWEELEGKEWIDLPFELQSVDAVLASVCSILADDVLDLQLGANNMIADLLHPGADVGDHAQEVMRTMKNSVKEMMSRVGGFCRALDLLLEDYEDMSLMNLSRLLTHPERFVQPVPQSTLEEESDEPELIVEAHLQRGHTLTNALALVEGQINSTEDFAVRKSDTIRNRLLYINMLISVFSLVVALASFVGSIFGMNVINNYEDSPTAFRIIVLSTVAAGFTFIFLIISLIRWSGALPNLF